MLDVPQHVLRFWESKFAHIRPVKRGGGRRYYRPEDIELLRSIRQLLHSEGYTIKGVQKLLRENGPGALRHAVGVALVADDETEATELASHNKSSNSASSDGTQSLMNVVDEQALRRILNDLEDLRNQLSTK